MKQVVFLTVNHCGPLPLREFHSTDETIVWRDPGGSWACLRPVSDYEWIHISRGCRWYRHVCGVFLKQVVFLTVNHRGPLPLGELHSTDETIVWRDPGGSWACLRPVTDYKWIHPSRGVCGVFVKQVIFFTVSPWTPPLEGTSLHRRNNSVERPWGILSLFMTCFWLRVNSHFTEEAVGDTDIYVCSIFVKQVIFLMVNHCGLLPLGALHSTNETIVWRDPGGSWACLWPVSEYKWFHPARVCDTYM